MNRYKTDFIITAVLCLFISFAAAKDTIKPVVPGTTSEAKSLLDIFYSISGRYLLTGQHNFPNTGGRNSEFAAGYIGKTPVIFSTDWGFAKEGDIDSYRARPAIVEEIKRQHQLGSIITICWHAVPPTADEPVTFRPQPDSSPDSLASVQGKLLDRQFKDILTPGTKLYQRWCAQVDTIAFYLNQLKKARIPVLWRPYHEMNGDWFWWGGREGEFGTAALYRQIFNRLVKHHKLNNLIWIWSVDRPVKPEMNFAHYFPGDKYLDILSLDVYRNDFKQVYYDSLLLLSSGKPMMLAEVGNPPSPEIMNSQPKWTSYVTWSGMVRNTLKKQYKQMVKDDRILGKEDTAYRNATASYRVICKLPTLPEPGSRPDSIKPDFSGEWIFNEETSLLDNFGVSNIPCKLKIIQDENKLTIQKTLIQEFADDRIINDTLTFDGKECRSEMWSFPQIIKARWAGKKDTLIVESKVIFNAAGRGPGVEINEFWTLEDQGRILLMNQNSISPWGERKITLSYDKKQVQ